MSNYQDQRMALAKRNAAHFAQNTAVNGILLVGSVARGTADSYSDIDCSIYYETPPDQAAFTAICERALASGGGVYGGTAEAGLCRLRIY